MAQMFQALHTFTLNYTGVCYSYSRIRLAQGTSIGERFYLGTEETNIKKRARQE
jgi:hypothetical protein